LPRRIGGSYSAYGRIATYSGYPNVLGWPSMNISGGAVPLNLARVNRIWNGFYTTPDWAEAQAILAQYKVRYVVVGTPERTAYRVNQAKFDNNLPVVFRSGDLVIYQVSSLDAIDQ